MTVGEPMAMTIGEPIGVTIGVTISATNSGVTTDKISCLGLHNLRLFGQHIIQTVRPTSESHCAWALRSA